MRRTWSGSRVSAKYLNSRGSSSSSSKSSRCEPVGLPRFNPQSYAAEKERSRLRSAEAAVHFIPLLLVLCAVLLWILSSPS